MSYSKHDYFTCDNCDESFSLHEKNRVKNACLCDNCYEAEDKFTCDNCDEQYSTEYDGKKQSGKFCYCEECFHELAEQARQEEAEDEADYRRATGWV